MEESQSDSEMFGPWLRWHDSRGSEGRLWVLDRFDATGGTPQGVSGTTYPACLHTKARQARETSVGCALCKR